MVLTYWFGPLVQANQVAKRGKVYIYYLFIYLELFNGNTMYEVECKTTKASKKEYF